METYLSTKQVAQRLGMAVSTLANWRSRNFGPPFAKLGKVIRYKFADVLAWAESRR